MSLGNVNSNILLDRKSSICVIFGFIFGFRIPLSSNPFAPSEPSELSPLFF